MARIYTVSDYVASKRSPGTAKVNEISLRFYLQFCYPDDVETSIDDLSIRHIQTADHAVCLREYVMHLVKEKKAPNSIQGKISNITQWYKWNGIILDHAEMSIIQSLMPRAVVIHEEKVVIMEDIKSIVAHSDPMLRAIVLLLVSSGMRIGEALGMQLSDLKQGYPWSAHIPRSRMKAGIAHTYFFSEEAAEAITEWLKVREMYLEQAGVKTQLCLKHAVSEDANRIFPIAQTTLRNKFRRTLEKCGLYEICEETRRTTIGFHSFRKYCESTMKLYAPINVVNELIGHDEGLSKHYRRYSDQMLRDTYLELEPHLTILKPADYAELKEHTAHAIQEQKETTAALASQMMKLQKEMEEIKAYMHSAD